MALSLFNTGYLPLEQRSMAENLFWAILLKLRRIVQTLDEVPEDLQNLDEQLSGHLFLQFLAVSVDSRQLGDQAAVPGDADPPPQRKAGRPRRPRRHHLRLGRQAGSIRRPARRQEDAAAPSLSDDGYYLGVFPVGAYQEILGDLHNLFGDTHAVHVSLDENGGRLDTLIKGDTVREVLGYVEFDAEMLLGKLRTDVETAVRDGRIGYEGAGSCSASTRTGLHGYTYLEGW
jgi:arginine decarboxylase